MWGQRIVSKGASDKFVARYNSIIELMSPMVGYSICKGSEAVFRDWSWMSGKRKNIGAIPALFFKGVFGLSDQESLKMEQVFFAERGNNGSKYAEFRQLILWSNNRVKSTTK
jgi:hypothetical protein